MTGLSKILQTELAPSLRSVVVLPLQLGCERDEELARLTEGRVPACTHDLVPDLLRTKPEPQAEQRLQQLNHKANTLSYDTAQVGLYNTMLLLFNKKCIKPCIFKLLRKIICYLCVFNVLLPRLIYSIGLIAIHITVCVPCLSFFFQANIIKFVL